MLSPFLSSNPRTRTDYLLQVETETEPEPGTPSQAGKESCLTRLPRPVPVRPASRYHSNWPICSIPVCPSLNQFLYMGTHPVLRTLFAAVLLGCFVSVPSWPDTHDSDYPARLHPAPLATPCDARAFAHGGTKGVASGAAASDFTCPRISPTVKPKLFPPPQSSRPTFSRKTNRIERAGL